MSIIATEISCLYLELTCYKYFLSGFFQCFFLEQDRNSFRRHIDRESVVYNLLQNCLAFFFTSFTPNQLMMCGWFCPVNPSHHNAFSSLFYIMSEHAEEVIAINFACLEVIHSSCE